MIQNKLLSLKCRILELILRRFFLFENFVRCLVFELLREILREGGNITLLLSNVAWRFNEMRAVFLLLIFSI